MITHAPVWDGPSNGRKRMTLCGSYELPRDIDAKHPTCEECQQELERLNDDRSAEDVFGAVGEHLSGPPPPKVVKRDIFEGYRPKGEKR